MKKILSVIILTLVLLVSSSCSFINDFDRINNDNINDNIISGAYETAYEDAFDKTSRADLDVLSGPEIYNKVAPSMVSIINIVNNVQQSEGSGIVMTANGLIITNAHVVEGANQLKVILNDENQSQYTTETFWYDTYTDLAIVAIDADNLTPADFGDSDEVQIGEDVYTLGNPGGYEFCYSITKGIVSYKYRSYAPISDSGYTVNCLQVDAAINPGNSGGALVNIYGQVIGINSAKIVSEGFENIGLSISINAAQPVISQLVSDNHSIAGRPALGITYTPAYNFLNRMIGIKIVSIKTESDLNNKGIIVNDIITKIGEYDMTSSEQITKALRGKSAGDTIEITYRKYSEDYDNEYTVNIELIDAILINS